MATTTKQDYYELLGVGRKATQKEVRGAYRKNGPQVSPRPEPRRQIRGREIQAEFKKPTTSSRIPRSGRCTISLASMHERRSAVPPEARSRALTSTSADSILAARVGQTSGIYSANSFRGGTGRNGRSPRGTGLGPGVRNPNRFLGSRTRHSKKSDHLPLGDLHGVQRHRRGGAGSKPARPAGVRDTLRKPPAACASMSPVRAAGVRAGFRPMCRACAGEGRVRRAETIEVRIPAGVQTGIAGASSRPRQRRDSRGAPRRSLFHYRSASRIRISTAGATISIPSCPSPSPKRRWALRSKCLRSMGVRCCACRREPAAARSFACERRACLRCATRETRRPLRGTAGRGAQTYR